MGNDYQPPPGPPPGYQNPVNNPYRQQQQQPPQNEQPPSYQPPPGPPPTWSDKKQPQHDQEYLPPPGGPSSTNPSFQPPPGPPPPQTSNNEPAPPPYDPWMQIPDNSLLPPPPSFHQSHSPTANATFSDAARAHAWTASNPLWQPRQHDQQTLTRITYGDVHLTSPPKTKHVTLQHPALGRTLIRTTSKCEDTIFLSDIPLFASCQHNPLLTEKARTTYFELEVKSMGSSAGDAGIALGFLAPPYPSWRLPGWHRASLGVHGDDGRRYVDDSDGGKDFVNAFRRGDVVGIGMHHGLPAFAGGKARVEVFFTRNGKQEGKWDLFEEKDRDQEGGDVGGLEGEHDLLAAVGCFGQVEFEVRFRREEWRF